MSDRFNEEARELMACYPATTAITQPLLDRIAARLRAQWAEAEALACAAVCDGCRDGSAIYTEYRMWMHPHTPDDRARYQCGASHIRRAFAPRKGESNLLDIQDRSRLESAICGALKTAIIAHGPITEANASSAAKRVYGLLKQHVQQQRAGRSSKDVQQGHT